MRIVEANVDMTFGGVFPVIHMNQGDSDFGIRLHLYNSEGELEIGSGASARVHGTKPDRTPFESSALLTGMDVVLAGTRALTSAAGKGIFEVELESGGELLHSQNFIINFEAAAMAED